jgi:hypothetical protein
MDFEFTPSLFISVLEDDCFDVAALLHKEFAYLMRENSPEENR